MKAAKAPVTGAVNRNQCEHGPVFVFMGVNPMLQTYRLASCSPVLAHTRGEARALLKAQLQAQQALTFRPQRVTRLPVGAKVERLLGDYGR